MTLPDKPESAWALVDDDVRSVFAEPFPGELVAVEPFGRDQHIASATTVAVPWRWVGRHEQPFLDIPPTKVTVEITGVTMLHDDPDGELRFHRLVDWLGLYTRLGVVIGSRTTIDRSRLLARVDAATS